MDPVTLALKLADDVVLMFTEVIKGMTPEDRAKYGHELLEQLTWWRTIVDRITPKE